MFLTGEKANEFENNNGSIVIPGGEEFEIDSVKHVSQSHIEVFFTGVVLHTNPPQLEIDRIVGHYKRNEKWAKIDISAAKNDVLLETFASVSGWPDFVTSTEQNNFYEAYCKELKNEVLHRMAKGHPF